MKQLFSPSITYRSKSEVAVFCKPIPLFLIMWALMLASLRMHLTYDTYPDFSLGLLLFFISVASLIAGYLVARMVASYHVAAPPVQTAYRVNLRFLRRTMLCLVVITSVIVCINLVIFGAPPLFAVFGATTLNYVDYGKLKQVLYAATMALATGAALEVSLWRKWSAYSFAFFCLIAYATRGFILVMSAQIFFAFCLSSKTSKKKLYYAAAATILIAVVVSNLIGNNRAEASIVAFFGITDTYANWPIAILWVLSYISSPISNMCWIVHTYQYTHPTLTFLTTMLPAFWAPDPLEQSYLGSPHIIDGVHTYLAKYYLDLWYFGIVLINFVWGLISAALTYRTRLVTRVLTSSVLLAAILFIFFADFLTILTILLEFGVLAMLERFAMIPDSEVKSAGEPSLAPAGV